MRIPPLVAVVLISASLISMAAYTIQDSRPDSKADGQKSPGTPMSSHDFPSRELAPHHKHPIKVTDGKTLLWAGGDRDGGEGAIWFDMTDALVDPATFQFGMGKDQIPSIDEPKFLPYGDEKLAEHRIGDQTDVIGYVHNGIAKAYPLFILDRHEIVNDEFAGSHLGVYW